MANALTAEQAQAFLTKSDLQRLFKLMEEQKLIAELQDGQPIVTVRGSVIPLFIVMDLIGTL